MSDRLSPACLRRFLAPSHARSIDDDTAWQATGGADTPGADARVRIFLARDPSSAERLSAAVFNAFGPPLVIAAADWVCERVGAERIDRARCLTGRDIEQALDLAPEQRYGGLVAVDALMAALDQLESLES